jgi:hypothetical protein
MANLVSPGVQVQISDESFYASGGPGTVPFLIFATAENKNQPGNTISIAPGTVKENAGKLYLMTSQRELIQTFGNPVFKTQAGTPQFGSELNELGLYTAYQYLGLANRAWVMRADVDLAALESRATPPTGSPSNGSFWLDLANTRFGLFRSNGNINSSLAWAAQSPIVIDSIAQLELVVQGQTATPIVDPNSDIIGTGGTLTISGLNVSVDSSDSLNIIIQKINTAAAASTNPVLRSIRAEAFDRVQVVGVGTSATVFNLRVISSIADLPGGLVFSGTGTVVSDLGLTGAPNHILPIAAVGTPGSLAVNTAAVLAGSSAVAGVQIAEKILITTDTGSTARWFIVGTTDSEAPGWGWREATPTVVRGTVANPTGFVSGDAALIGVGSSTVSFSSTAGNLSAFVSQLNTAFDGAGVNALAEIRSQGPDAYLQITNYDGTDLVFVDSANTPFANAGMGTTTTFYGSTLGTVANPTFTPGDSFTITVGSAVASITISDTSIDDVINDINSDPTVGVTGLIVASKVNVGGNEFLQISSSNNSFFTLRNNSGFADPVPPLVKAGILTGIAYGNALVYQGYTVNTPQPGNLNQVASGNIWINTVPGNRGADWRLRRYNAGLESWVPVTAPLYENDTVANAGYGVNRTPGSLYVRFNSFGSSPANATFQVRAWNGTAWEPAAGLILNSNTIPYTQSFDEPTGTPDQGALWFNQNLRVDVMVSNGQIWMGYGNMYPGTDPAGVILSATQPSVQSDNTPLEDNDLWIDTSDLENYPKIYRYDSLNVSWELIDTSDQTSSQGIVFADARPNDNGLVTGSESISSMLASNYVDPDAPSALAYPFGFLLFNTRYSTNNVKEWRPNYLSTGVYRDRWVTASGNDFDGSPLMGRRAQRIMVVRSMAGAVVSNQDLRAEGNFFNLLAAPGYPELADELLALNTDKKDVGFVVVDTPARLTPDGTSVQAWSNNSNNAPSNGEVGMITSSRYMAVYYPWGLATNLDGTEVFVPPSTAVLRTYAFNDQVSYPWFAPAGFNRGLVTAFTSVGYLNSESEYVPVQLSQGQRDVLYVNKINPIAFIPGRGLVIYGQKTRSPVESALDRVNVARLVNFLNYQLDNLAKPFLFEPNDQFTRDSVQRTFESFFGDLVSLRAVFDYSVLCNETNNTPERIDRNELFVDIAIKPIKSIEFIYIPLRILNTGDPLPT